MTRTGLPGTGQAYLLYAVSVVLVLTLGSAAQVAAVYPGLVFTEIAIILLPAVVFVWRKRLPVAKALCLRPVSIGLLLASVVLGVTGWGVAAGIHELSVPWLGPSPTVAAMVPDTLTKLMLLVLTVGLLAGICEEILFRGAIQSILMRRGRIHAVVITSVLFGLFHMNPWVIVPATFLGAVFGLLAARTGSVLPSIVAHCGNNLTAVAVACYSVEPNDATIAPWIMAMLAVFFVPVAFVMMRLTKAASRESFVLANVPCGITHPLRWLVGGLVAVPALVVVAIAVLAFTLIKVVTVADDSLVPNAKRGDRCVIVLNRSVVEIQPSQGETVLFAHHGSEQLAIVERVDKSSFWVKHKDGEFELANEAFVGKVVQVVPAP